MSIKFTMVYLLGVIGGAAMTMTPELLTAVGALLVAVITAIGAVVVNILTARKVEKVKELAQENLAETQVVKGHVNSAAAAAEAKIEGLRKELLMMQGVAAQNEKTAALLAQAAAKTTALLAQSTAIEHTPPNLSLQHIELNIIKIEKRLADAMAEIKAIKPKTPLT